MENMQWFECLFSINVTHHKTVALKVNMKNLESELNVYVNVTHHKTDVLKVNVKYLEWDSCLSKCYTSYHSYSQSKQGNL
jgi:hypothetical protein